MIRIIGIGDCQGLKSDYTPQDCQTLTILARQSMGMNTVVSVSISLYIRSYTLFHIIAKEFRSEKTYKRLIKRKRYRRFIIT